MRVDGGWIADVDLRKYFDTIDHGRLREFLQRRVRDGVLLRLIGKWLNAGVLEDGELSYPDEGTPQGGVVSPLLANIFLHYVLDEWFVGEVRPRLEGHAAVIRYADDFLIVSEHEEDARRVMDVLPRRMEKYGLTIHPQKSRLVDFRSPEADRPDDSEGKDPGGGTFDFLGFTHYWGRSLRGTWVVRKKTARGRLRRALDALWGWCRDHRHEPLEAQHGTLKRKLLGHYAYYGITGNYYSIRGYHWQATRSWKYWLGRRHRDGTIPWGRFARLLKRYPLPRPRIVHPWNRLAAKPS
jgi:group II intron reverse transcriptase/maturase